MAVLCPDCSAPLGRISGQDPGFYCRRCGHAEREGDKAPEEAPEPGVIELRLRPGWESIVDSHFSTVAEALDEGMSVAEAIERANESVQGDGDDG